MNKDVLLIIFIAVTVGALVLAFIAFEKIGKLSKSLEEERYSRMVAEESSQKSAAKMASIENQLKSSSDKMAKLKDIIDQEKGVNEELKNQFDNLAQTKAVLESKLRATLEEKAAVANQQLVQDSPATAVDSVPVAAGAQ